MVDEKICRRPLWSLKKIDLKDVLDEKHSFPLVFFFIPVETIINMLITGVESQKHKDVKQILF